MRVQLELPQVQDQFETPLDEQVVVQVVPLGRISRISRTTRISSILVSVSARVSDMLAKMAG